VRIELETVNPTANYQNQKQNRTRLIGELHNLGQERKSSSKGSLFIRWGAGSYIKISIASPSSRLSLSGSKPIPSVACFDLTGIVLVTGSGYRVQLFPLVVKG